MFLDLESFFSKWVPPVFRSRVKHGWCLWDIVAFWLLTVLLLPADHTIANVSYDLRVRRRLYRDQRFLIRMWYYHIIKTLEQYNDYSRNFPCISRGMCKTVFTAVIFNHDWIYCVLAFSPPMIFLLCAIIWKYSCGNTTNRRLPQLASVYRELQ